MDIYLVYILRSETTGKYYIGHTSDIEKRLRQHNNHLHKGSASTKRMKGPRKLVYSEPFNSRSVAMKREKQLKAWKNKQAIEGLIAQSVESRRSRD